MDWENEYWIRCYVKDSPSFAKCSWQAKGLFFLIARKVNAAGIILLVKDDPVESARYLSTLLEAPWREIRPHVKYLIDTETIHIPVDWSVLAVPNFQFAQHAKWSDKFRKKTERQRKKDSADMPEVVPADPSDLYVPPPTPSVPCPRLPEVNIEPHRASDQPDDFQPLDLESVPAVQNPVVHLDTTVTPCDGPFNADGNAATTDMVNVTPRDVLSTIDKQTEDLRRDTTCLSSVCSELGESKSLEGEERSAPDMGSVPVPGQLTLLDEVAPLPPTKAQRLNAEVDRAWEYYMSRWASAKDKPGGPQPTLTPKRRAHLRKRIEEVGTEPVLAAIDKLWDNPWRVRSGYTMIDYAVKSPEKLEMILAQSTETKTNGGNGKRPAPLLQPSCAPDYQGHGIQYMAGTDGIIRDQHGNEVQINDDLDNVEWT
jgi:hypothetical protein